MSNVFAPGTLTRRQADALNALLDWKSTQDKITVAGPLVITRMAGIPCISIAPVATLAGGPGQTLTPGAVTTGDSSGDLQSAPQYVVTGTNVFGGTIVNQYTVPNLGADPTTGPVLQYTIENNYDGTGATRILQYTVTNGTSGDSGVTQSVVSNPAGVTQNVTQEYSVGGLQLYQVTNLTGGGLLQYTVGNPDASTGVIQYVVQPETAGKITGFTQNVVLNDGVSDVTAGIVYSVGSGVVTATYPAMNLNLSSANVTATTQTSTDNSTKIATTAFVQSLVGGAGGLAWVKITKTFTDFSTAATSNTIALYTLAAGGVIHAVKVKHSTAFSGGAIASYNLTGIGIAANHTRYASMTFNMTAAVTGTNGSITSSLPANPSNTTTDDQGATTAVVVSVSANANLNTATQGSVDIWLLVSVAG